VKKPLGIGMTGMALAAILSLAVAGAHEPGAIPAFDALPAYEILTTIRDMGLDPIGEPARRGPYYVLHAYDPSGTEVRVVADAQFGDILSIVPARALNAAYTPHYVRGPRIIHVPKADESGRVTPRPQSLRDASPPPAGHHTMPGTPPVAADNRLMPIYPTPHFNAKNGRAEEITLPPAENNQATSQ
jgi:hypothetical protein